MASKNKQMDQQEKDINFIKKLLSIFWTVLSFIGNLIAKIVVGIYFLIKSMIYGVSALIAASAIMIIACALSVYLVSIGLGLKDSPKFAEWRDLMIQEHREAYEAQRIQWAMKEPRAAEDYTVAEVSDQSCTSDADCVLPMDYAIRSVCPYTSRCIENKCTVVCPRPFNHPGQ